MFTSKGEFLRPMARFSAKRVSWCQWCCARAERKELFKVKDGPIDWYFCDAEHYELWLRHRCCWPVSEVLKMTPFERREALDGKTTAQYVSELKANGIIQDCGNPTDGVRNVHYGSLPVPKTTELPS